MLSARSTRVVSTYSTECKIGHRSILRSRGRRNVKASQVHSSNGRGVAYPVRPGGRSGSSVLDAKTNGAGASLNGSGNRALQNEELVTIEASPSADDPNQVPRNLNGAAPQPSKNDAYKADNSVALTQASQKSEQSSKSAPGAAPVDDGSPYQQVGFSAWRRTLQIYAFALTFAFRYWRLGKAGTYSKMPGGMSPENVSAKKAELAKWLRQGLIRLGPTFIKIGQQFSTRVDVLSKEFISELELLQDRVPPFGADAVRSTLEKSFGKPVEELFDEFDFQPLAAASLGQVHLAKFNGKKVVVKVQRPGLRELFAVDLKNVRVIAQWLQKLDPKSDGAARDWVAIYDECSRILYEEIDYRMEAAYAQEFAANFADVSWVKVPAIEKSLLAPNVLVMEYVPGVKINNADAIDAMGLDRDRLAKLSVESYLQQLLRYGLFHADPHPGNVACDSVNGGRLIYYDFGMMGRIQPFVRDGLRDLFYGVYQRDVDKCLEALGQMGVLVGGDRTAIKRTAEFFLKQFEQRLAEQRAERERNPDSQNSFKPKRSKEESKEKRKAILANIGEDILVAAADKPFRFPAEFTFVVRSFTVLDGIGKALSPRFDISEISAPYARELILDGRPALSRLQDKVAKGVKRQNQAVKGLFDGPLKINAIQEAVERIESGSSKPRVRALEVERAVARLATSQTMMTCLVAASMFVNIGTVLSVSALPLGSTLSFSAGALCALIGLINFFKLKQAQKKEAQLLGTA